MKTLFFLVLLFLVNGRVLYSQIKNVDALKEKLWSIDDDADKVDLFNKIGMYYRYINIDSATFYCQKAYELAVILDDENKLVASIYNMGIISRIKGDYGEALSQYYESLLLAEKNSNAHYIVAISNAIGVIHKIHEENAVALRYFNEALQSEYSAQSPRALGSINNNIGEVYLAMNEYDSALKYCFKSLGIRTKIKEKQGCVKSLNNIGNIFIKMENFDSSRHYFEIALENSHSNNDELGQLGALIGLSQIYNGLNSFDNSITYALLAKKKAERLEAKLERLEVFQLLINGYAEKLDYKTAFEFQGQYVILQDSVFNENKTIEINRLQLNREEAENAILKNKNDIQLLTIERQKERNLAVTIILIVAILLSILLLREYLFKRRANNALNIQKLELQKSNDLKSKLLSIISHDFRAPLNNLNSMIGLITDDFISGDEFKKLLGKILQQVNVTSNFLNSLLHWAKYQINTDQMKMEAVQITPLIEQLRMILEPQLEAKGITLTNNLTDNNLSVMADKEVVTLIFKNLISNAIKFSYAQGEIVVDTAIKEKMVEIKIKDAGIGISESVLKKLFMFESNVTTEGTSGEKGTGLGLAFCKEFINLIGGDIWVESKPDEGTTFCFSLVLSDGPQ